MLISTSSYTNNHNNAQINISSKLNKNNVFGEELKTLKENLGHKLKYNVEDSKKLQTKRLSDLIKDAENNGGSTIYHDINFVYNSISKQIQIGNMKEGRILSVGLSNGCNLKFNKDSIDDLIKIWDIFSPGDRRKIMESIIVDNMVLEAEKDIEEAKDGLVKGTDGDKMERKSKEKNNTDSTNNMQIDTDVLNLLLKPREILIKE